MKIRLSEIDSQKYVEGATRAEVADRFDAAFPKTSAAAPAMIKVEVIAEDVVEDAEFARARALIKNAYDENRKLDLTSPGMVPPTQETTEALIYFSLMANQPAYRQATAELERRKVKW